MARLLNRPLVIFTDLDGTLLDLSTYSADQAEEGLNLARDAGIPLIFSSSKTRAEQEHLRDVLGIADPFIVENGSALFVPSRYFPFDYEHVGRGSYNAIELGRPAAPIRQALADIRSARGFLFTRYTDLSLDEVCRLTGLDIRSAARAVEREYSETIVANFDSAEFSRFEAELAARELLASKGSRFITVTAAGSDKGRAVSLLASLYRRRWSNVETVGIGDSANDIPMLTAVDRAFLVQKPGGEWVAAPERVERVTGVGPAGWVNAVHALLR